MAEIHEPPIVITTPAKDTTKAQIITGAGVLEIDLVNKTIKLVYPEMGDGWGPGIKRFAKEVDLYQTLESVRGFESTQRELGAAIISETHTILKKANSLAIPK